MPLPELMSKRFSFGRLTPLAAVTVWATAVGLGMCTLIRYENTSAAAGAAPPRWPTESRIQRRNDRFTLLMFMHPDCPCSRASIAELEMLAAKLQGRLDVFIQFRKPGMLLSEAQASELWKSTSAIPNATVLFDVDGSEMREFGAAVSGQAMLYDKAGKLVFNGGITPGRGRVGEARGANAVLLSVGGVEAPTRAPVFGCSLHDPTAEEIRDSSWRKR